MTSRLWVLGAPDPEMVAIESLLRTCGEKFVCATSGGQRVTGGTAYLADPVAEATHWIECESPGQPREVVIDHHHPDDPGFGRPPAEFLAASSIGQVYAVLDRLGWEDVTPEEPPEDMLVAAADHCLRAAYRGECPDVDPDMLMRWRIKTRATHQGRSPTEILTDVERAREALREAPIEILSIEVDSEPFEPLPYYITCRDVRDRHVPELPEAAAREGLCFLSTVTDRDGRVKVVCQVGSPEQIQAFLGHWAPAHGLIDTYGDPARGFAGGYLP